MAEAAPRGRGRGRGAPRGRAFGQKRPIESYDYDEYSGMGGGGYSKKRKIMDDVYRFLVREDLVKSVIGKGGDNIKLVKEEAKEQGIQTKVSIYAQGANGASLMEGALDRVMSVQTTMEGLEMALHHLAPTVQINSRGGRGPVRGGRGGSSGQKLELRLIVPSHCCSGIIGKGGSVIRKIKEETKSYIQVYTLPLPLSEEYCVRIQNFELPDLITTAVRVFESIAEIKGKNPITMYDPIYFEHGEYGDTGSYIDTEWYQEAIKSGVAQPIAFKTAKSVTGRGGPSYGAGYAYEEAYQYDDYSEYGYDDYGYGYGGYEEYEDPYYYDYAPPAPRARGRGGPRTRAFSTPRGGPRGMPGRGMPARGRGGFRGSRGSPYRGARSAPPPAKSEAMDVTETSSDATVQEPVEAVE